MTASEARRLHADKIMASRNFVENLADASLNPTFRQANYLYMTWRQNNLGSSVEPLEKLEVYKAEGCSVHISKEYPWVVTLSTAIMQRAQKLQSSKEIIFLDTTASCEANNSNVTVFLTVTDAGAVPLAIFIHEAQTAECYRKAFLLKGSSHFYDG